MVKDKSTKGSDTTIRLLEDFINVTKRWIDVIDGKASIEELKQILMQMEREAGEVEVGVKVKPKRSKSRGKKGA